MTRIEANSFLLGLLLYLAMPFSGDWADYKLAVRYLA